MFTVHGSLKLALYTLTTERDRLKTALESDSTFLLNCGNTISSSTATGNIVASLRNSLNQALQQNVDLRSRLARIHDTADLSDISSVGPASEMVSFTRHCIQQLVQHNSHSQAPHASCECSSHMQLHHDVFFHCSSFKNQAGTCYRVMWGILYRINTQKTHQKNHHLNKTQCENLKTYITNQPTN